MTGRRCESLFGRELVSGAHQIGPSRRGIWKGGYSRSYLFEDGPELTLVDTGWDADAGIILRYLEDIGRSPGEITNIALTHAHRSHLGGVARLAQLSGADVWCHATEAPIVAGLERADPIRLWPPLPLRLIPFRIISWLPILKHDPCPVKPEHLVVDGECIGPLTVLRTPGHTEGHLAFRYRDSVLAVGDAVATWPRKCSAGWPGFNRDNRQYRQSLMRLVASEPDVVCPGHGDAIVEHTADRLHELVRGRKFRRSAMV